MFGLQQVTIRTLFGSAAWPLASKLAFLGDAQFTTDLKLAISKAFPGASVRELHRVTFYVTNKTMRVFLTLFTDVEDYLAAHEQSLDEHGYGTIFEALYHVACTADPHFPEKFLHSYVRACEMTEGFCGPPCADSMDESATSRIHARTAQMDSLLSSCGEELADNVIEELLSRGMSDVEIQRAGKMSIRLLSIYLRTLVRSKAPVPPPSSGLSDLGVNVIAPPALCEKRDYVPTAWASSHSSSLSPIAALNDIAQKFGLDVTFEFSDRPRLPTPFKSCKIIIRQCPCEDDLTTSELVQTAGNEEFSKKDAAKHNAAIEAVTELERCLTGSITAECAAPSVLSSSRDILDELDERFDWKAIRKTPAIFMNEIVTRGSAPPPVYTYRMATGSTHHAPFFWCTMSYKGTEYRSSRSYADKMTSKHSAIAVYLKINGISMNGRWETL